MHPRSSGDCLRCSGVHGLGMSEEEILSDFPDLELADIRACLSFAADRERRLVSLPPV